MIPDFPLGITDLFTVLMKDLTEPDYWTWCRRHQEPEHANTPTKRDDDPTVSCIRIGPFMSEHEASRLNGQAPGRSLPLGMEVEK